MSYSVCGLIVPQREERVCSERRWPFVTLRESVLLLPFERDYLFLTDGDDTPVAEALDFSLPQWLSDIVSHFTRSAYVEAEFWGGTGMQASVVLERSAVFQAPQISARAINSALRLMGIDDGPSVTFFGVPAITRKDPFDMVGLGRHRSVGDWLRESAEQRAAANRH